MSETGQYKRHLGVRVCIYLLWAIIKTDYHSNQLCNRVNHISENYYRSRLASFLQFAIMQCEDHFDLQFRNSHNIFRMFAKNQPFLIC